jgi:hypothetical protein
MLATLGRVTGAKMTRIPVRLMTENKLQRQPLCLYDLDGGHFLAALQRLEERAMGADLAR